VVKLPKQAVTALSIMAASIVLAVLLFLMKSPPDTVEIKRQNLIVDVAVADKETLSIPVFSQGNVEPSTQTNLVSEVSGKVMEVAPQFETGGLVEAGSLLLTIDDRIYRAELKRAETAVATARSALVQEKGRARVARDDLMKYPRKYSSREALALALRKPQLAEAEARLESAEADRQQAKINLARTRIRAPYTGLIKARQVDLGQFVPTGSQVGQIFAVDRAEIRLPIPADRLPYLELPDSRHPDRTPAVELENDLGDRWKAKIVRTEGVLDTRSRVLFVVAEVQDPYRLNTPGQPLLAGSFVKAKIAGRKMSDLIALPRHILRTGNQVWVIDQQQQLSNRYVEVLKTEGDYVYIHDGLVEGDRICLSTIPNAVAGTSVEINTSRLTSSLHQEQTTETTATASPSRLNNSSIDTGSGATS
jgi:RND family efflux transporter MFP subunit